MTTTEDNGDSYSQGLIIGFRMVQVAIGITVSRSQRNDRHVAVADGSAPGWIIRFGAAHLLVRKEEGRGALRFLVLGTARFPLHTETDIVRAVATASVFVYVLMLDVSSNVRSVHISDTRVPVSRPRSPFATLPSRSETNERYL